jgi:hypothetical protein
VILEFNPVLWGNAKSLGEFLARAAYLTVEQGAPKDGRYVVDGACFTLKASTSGPRYAVVVAEETDAGTKIIFTLEHTGDGFTYVFQSGKHHSSISKQVVESAKDFATRYFARR